MKRTVLFLFGLAVLATAVVYVRQVVRETIESPVAGQRYVVSLGDSVAAGVGLSSTQQRPSGCGTTGSAFPILLGQQLHKPVKQFACSGATIAPTATNASNTLLGSQLQMAKPYLAGSDVVVTAGANDIGWLQLLTSCAQVNCATDQTSAAVTAKLAVMQKNLAKLLGQLQQARPHRLVVNTYYSLLAPDDTCFAQLGITPQEVNFINSEETELNAAITAAAAQAKAIAVAVDFSGHTLCASDSWTQTISDSAPLHPTAAGQQQIAAQDARAFMVDSTK